MASDRIGLDTLTGELLAVVDYTTQPTTVCYGSRRPPAGLLDPSEPWDVSLRPDGLPDRPEAGGAGGRDTTR
jgi:hypothetical protein